MHWFYDGILGSNGPIISFDTQVPGEHAPVMPSTVNWTVAFDHGAVDGQGIVDMSLQDETG